MIIHQTLAIRIFATKWMKIVREGFPDTEIVRGVLRIIKSGAFKDMLINKYDLTVIVTERVPPGPPEGEK